MAILKVCRMGHPVLRQEAAPVEEEAIGSQDVQRLIADMVDTMREYHGVGLAAPQVHVSLQIAVIGAPDDREDDDDPGSEARVLVNPEIRPIGRRKAADWEGCLSIPDIRGRVPRWERISVRALGADGKPLSLEAEGFPARVIQHEVDHLNGVLFLDRMRNLEPLSFVEEYVRYWQE